MSPHLSTNTRGESSTTLLPHGSRPLRSHDLGNAFHSASKRSPSPSTARVKNTMQTESTGSFQTEHDTRKDGANGGADDDADEDEDEDDSNSGPNQGDDGDEPEVKAPLHASHACLSRAQAATTGLQNVLESTGDQDHGAGLRNNSINQRTPSSPTRKRTFGQAQLSMYSEDDPQEALNNDQRPRKKIQCEPGDSQLRAGDATAYAEITQDDHDYDADVEMLQHAARCEDDDTFVDDDNYDDLPAVSDNDEGPGITLLETLNIQTGPMDESDLEFDSDFNTPQIPRKLDTIFDIFGPDQVDFEVQDNMTLFSQHDDLAPAFPPTNPKANASDGSGRRVRFEDEVHGSSQASSTGSSAIRREYPDILLSQDSLDAPLFPRGPIGGNNRSRAHSSPNGSEGSYWDFNDGNYQPDSVPMSNSSENSPGSSGYESEHSYDASDAEGSTTEEEVFAPPTISRPHSLLHEPPSPPGQRRRVARRNGQPPRSQWSDSPSPEPLRPSLPPRGTFRVNIHQRIAITDWTGNRMLMYNMGDPKCSCNSDRNCINGKPKQASISHAPISQTPNTPAESMNMTFNSLVEDQPSTASQEQVVGPFEAFFPFYNVEADGSVTQDQLDSYEGDADMDESEMDLDINNFITYEKNDSDDEMEDAFALESPSTSEQEQAEADRLARRDTCFEGYDSNTITSFRRNLDRAQEVSRLPEHPTLRNSGNLSNAYRQGRDSAGDSLITPPRRRRSDRGVESALQI